MNSQKTYKLININTNIATICNKITKVNIVTICNKISIDGFDYYVSDEIPQEKEYYIKDNILSKRIEDKYGKGYDDVIKTWSQNAFYSNIKAKKVIATNNPNLEIPQVVDEVEKLGEEETNIRILQHKTPSQIARQYFDGFIKGYKKCQETHHFSEEDVKEIFKIAQMQKNYGDYKPYTFEEAIQIWKEQPKIVYYA